MHTTDRIRYIGDRNLDFKKNILPLKNSSLAKGSLSEIIIKYFQNTLTKCTVNSQFTKQDMVDRKHKTETHLPLKLRRDRNCGSFGNHSCSNNCL